MRLSLTGPEGLREQLGLMVAAEGKPLRASIERLLLLTVSRWRLVERHEVRRAVQRQLEACGFGSSESLALLKEAEERLLLLGELAQVTVNEAPYLAAAELRWVRTTPRVGILVGTLPALPPGLTPVTVPGGLPPTLVRRFEAAAPAAVAALLRAGARETSLEEWLGPPAPERLLRLLGEPAFTSLELTNLWSIHARRLQREGQTPGDPESYRALSGPPGGFFGDHSSPEPTGRWRSPAPDGIWCGARSGYNERHWHPVLLETEGGAARRAVDLSGWDEWGWLVLARGLALGPPEVTRCSEGTVELTFRPPFQVRRVLELLGEPHTAWAWRVPPGLERTWDVWGLLR